MAQIRLKVGAAILNGCAISEDWSGTGGFRGNSLNFYDADTKLWHQTWIDSQGQSLALEGRFEGGSMVLQSAATKNAPRHRITWTPAADKTVRQFWQFKKRREPIGKHCSTAGTLRERTDV